MKNGLIRAFMGCLVWRKIKRKYHINGNTVVVVLPENDAAWNKAALSSIL